MKNSPQKGSAVIWAIVVIVIIVLVAGGVYWYMQSQAVNQPQPVSTSSTSSQNTASLAMNTANPAIVNDLMASSTAGWQTYTNSQYGFSIKYPVGSHITDEGVQADGSEGIMLAVLESNALYSNPLFYITAIPNASQAICENMEAAMTLVATSSVNIDGISFIKGDVSEPATGQRLDATQYCTIRGNTAYKLVPTIEYGRDDSTSNGFNPAINVDNDLILNQMLQTFQFTN